MGMIHNIQLSGNSIFQRISSYSFIKTVVLGMEYEEGKAGGSRSACQNRTGSVDDGGSLFNDTRREKIGVVGIFGRGEVV